MLLSILDSAFAPAPGAALGWLNGARVAHRGLHGDGVVENSPAAFEAAAIRGLAIECDVQLTADGEAVVFHDFTLERLTREEGPVLARTAAQLAEIRYRASAETIPTFAQFLAQIEGRVPLLIEVKSQEQWDWARLCAAVARGLEGYAGPAAVMSFDARVGGWFAAHAPHVVRGLVASEEHSKGWWGDIKRHRALWQSRAQLLAYDVRDLPSRFAAAQRARGLPVATWTVRDPALFPIATANADALIAEGSIIA